MSDSARTSESGLDGPTPSALLLERRPSFMKRMQQKLKTTSSKGGVSEIARFCVQLCFFGKLAATLPAMCM